MKIPLIKLNPTVILPQYQSTGAAAMDVCACLDTPTMLRPMERKVIPTGFAIALPQGYEAQIRARSGLSLKHGIVPANGIGTIDSDYRGEVGVILINLGEEAFEVTHGMRIAQMVIARYEPAEWDEVTELDKTERGAGGYGSTGN